MQIGDNTSLRGPPKCDERLRGNEEREKKKTIAICIWSKKESDVTWWNPTLVEPHYKIINIEKGKVLFVPLQLIQSFKKNKNKKTMFFYITSVSVN